MARALELRYHASILSRRSHLADATNFVVHLRLPFQLVLAPFMLWGAALARTPVTFRFVVAFAVLHLAMYGGATAYNSHYDRDEGPVGGLAHPPPPGPWLLPGSLALQAVGLAVAVWVSVAFFTVCLAFGTLGIAYSHPVTRWKAHPWLSWVVVVFGQGMLGATAGIVARRQHVSFSTEVVYGVLAAGVLVGALYPLTQLFQFEEDAARGDRTFAMALGRKGTRTATVLLSILGSALAALSAHAGGRDGDAILLAATAVPMCLGAAWVCDTDDPAKIFKRISVFQSLAGGAFAAYAGVRLWLG